VGPRLGCKRVIWFVVFTARRFCLLLREKERLEGRYELVGEAYCDGIMDREALSMGLEDVWSLSCFVRRIWAHKIFLFRASST